MFKTPQSRFALRAVLVGLFAAASALRVYLPGLSWDDVAQLVSTGVVSSLGYAGIGAALPQVEPNVGRRAPEPTPPTTVAPAAPPPAPPAP